MVSIVPNDRHAGDDHPRLVLPPPVYLGLAIALAVVAQLALPLYWIDDLPLRIVTGMVCCILAAALALWAMLRFKDARTHVEPHKPTTALVVTGPYRYTRNPIYLGFLLLVLGLALILANPWALLVLPLLWAALRYLVISVEEAFLLGRFGPSYRDYKAAVRRWT
jgi:protein-S-isoprenylcysteine O-methyltransferase Ste14